MQNKDLAESADRLKKDAVQTKQDLADAASKVGDHLHDKASDMRDTVKAHAADLRDTVSSHTADIRDNVSGKLRQIGVDTEKMAGAARGKASALQDVLEQEIRDRPLRAIGVAAAIGLVVGLLTSR